MCYPLGASTSGNRPLPLHSGLLENTTTSGFERANQKLPLIRKALI